MATMAKLMALMPQLLAEQADAGAASATNKCNIIAELRDGKTKGNGKPLKRSQIRYKAVQLYKYLEDCLETGENW